MRRVLSGEAARREKRGRQESLGFWIPDPLSLELGFRIPIVSEILDSFGLIQDSKA